MESQDTRALQIERLEPEDGEDLLRRSLFYCHCLHLYSKRTLELLLNRADAGEFDPDMDGQIALVSDWQLESIYKLITCISLHMAGLDNIGGDAPAWLIEFFSGAARETDELFPNPLAIDIIARHGSWKREKMIRDVVRHVCEILGFEEEQSESPDAAPLFSAELRRFLAESANYRSELLLFALSQPPEALRRQLEMLAG